MPSRKRRLSIFKTTLKRIDVCSGGLCVSERLGDEALEVALPGQEKIAFHTELAQQMDSHGETCAELHRAIEGAGVNIRRSTISAWRAGRRTPGSVESRRALSVIEDHYGIASGGLSACLPCGRRSATGHLIDGASASERRRLAWHLPENFNQRPKSERAEIIAWVRSNIISSDTPFTIYQKNTVNDRFGLRFSASALDVDQPYNPSNSEPRTASAKHRIPSPPRLDRQIAEFLRFKSRELEPGDMSRVGRWREGSVRQRAVHLGLFFGALAAPAASGARGHGIKVGDLSFALLAFPQVWRWYLAWRRHRRGFYTLWEADMLQLGAALTRPNTGWLRQSPQLATSLQIIPGLIARDDLLRSRSRWDELCDETHHYTKLWSRDVQRIANVHRDGFAAISTILDAERPAESYSKISKEILRRLPSKGVSNISRFEAIRSFLMISIGLRTGFRQKNLRELRIVDKGSGAIPLWRLVEMRCGQIKFCNNRKVWEIFVPRQAFKNGASGYFNGRDFHLVLPDTGELYAALNEYALYGRSALLAGHADENFLFVKNMRHRRVICSGYSETGFYEAWRQIIQRYGIYNPYTCRGAIRGLLPHGPHAVRHVLATHVLKLTGSFEMAGYAIQDTAEMVQKYYARFLPQDKAAIAAAVLDDCWI